MNDVKKFLSENRRLQDIYDAKFEQLKELRELASCIKSPMDGSEKVQSSNNGNKTEELIIKIVALEEELKGNLNALLDRKIDITNKLNGIDDAEYKLLLNLRYLNFMTWEEIACKMGYTFQWVHTLHKSALVSFSKKYSEAS